MKKLLFILSILILFLSGCAQVKVQAKKYYIMEYKSVKEKKETFQNQNFNYVIRVLDAELPRTYDRKQIVLRTSENMIEYDYDNLWADQLNSSISSLVYNRLSRYKVFPQVIKEIQQRADYEVVMQINAIEFMDYKTKWAAHLNMDFYLRRTSDNQFVVHYYSERSSALYEKNFEMYVQTLNDLLMEETDRFLEKSIKYLNSPLLNAPSDSLFLNGNGHTLTVLSDSTTYKLNEGDFSSLGRLYLNSKTDPDYEPPYSITDANGISLGSYKMGSDALLEPGKYTVEVGSGSASQKIVKEVEIYPRYKYMMKPEWGWLTINILDENRNEIDERYELFDLETTESYGFGYGVQEGVGQKLETWILKPGYYKLVMNGLSFNTYTNFATIEVKAGEHEQLTVVYDTQNNSMQGAGKFIQDSFGSKNKLKVSILNHLNANFSSNNSVEKKKYNYTSTVNEQLDSKLIYDSFPHYYSMKNITELGISKDTGLDLKFSTDKFDLKNTYVFFFFNWIGAYSRADLNTHFLSEYILDKSNKKYKKIDKDGNETNYFTKKLQVKSSFYPLITKEGLGLNLRLFNTSKANLNIRTGLGLRQDINRDVFLKDSESGDTLIYKESNSVYQRGTEVSVNGNFQIFPDLTYSTNADLLFPFNKNKYSNIDWENNINLRIFKAVSWDYSLNMKYNKDVKNYVDISHTLYLRFTYIFTR
jgi:ABC-type uncharacterized transport system auxiliary subunit